jgi:predicted CoA-binding protein
MNVAVLGASIKESRYSNLAVKALKDAGHNVFPVHKVYKNVHGIDAYHSVLDIKEKIHTLSVYVCTECSGNLSQEILKLNPERIIFNPGSENYDLRDLAEKKGIKVIFACTLVMISTGIF